MAEHIDGQNVARGASRLSRRAALRGAGLGLVGIGGAALIGCSGADDSSGDPASGESPVSGSPGSAPSVTPAGGGAKRGGTLAVDSNDPSSPRAGGGGPRGSRGGGGPRGGGTLAVDSNDPSPPTILFGPSPRNSYIRDGVWDSLITVENYEVRNVLAESFDFTPDFTGATVKLRSGVEFHDGRPLTAADVVASVEYYLAGTGQFSGALKSAIAGINQVDDLTVEMSFTGSLPVLADIFHFVKIIDKNTIDTVQDFKTMNGTGPFKFSGYIAGESHRLERNENYWGEGPYLDAIEATVFPDDEARILALKTGQLMHTNALSFQMIANLRDSGDDVVVVNTGSQGNDGLGLVTDKEPFTDPRVRRALQFALDRRRYVDSYTEGVPEVQILPWGPGSAAYSEDDAALVRYDPDEARRLLDEAGATGAVVEIATDDPDLMVYVQDDLKAVGLDARVKTYEAAVFTDMIRTRTVETNAFHASQGFGASLHPSATISLSQHLRIPNPAHYETEEYVASGAKLATLGVDDPEFAALASEWNQRFLLEPWVLILAPRAIGYHAMRASVHGDNGPANGNRMYPERWWIE